MISKILRQSIASVLIVMNAAIQIQAASSAFGYTQDSNRWVITTGAGLVVTMNKSSCDITSLLYNGNELQYNVKGTHLNSGMVNVASTALTAFTDTKSSLQVTCVATGLTQYYYFRANENNVYMGTYHTADLQLPELRFLARLTTSQIGSGPTQSIVAGGTAIESSDVYKVGSETRSKYYSGVPFIDDHYHGVWGTGGGVYMVMPDQAYETSIGGPFFRDINVQTREDVNELTFYMNSDHSRTEEYRYGFHGPYALAITSGSAPSGLDFSFIQSKTMTGFVPDANRGKVTGTISDASGILTGSKVVVHFFNSAAQYWTTASGTSFTSPMMKPGTYSVAVYKKELPVASGSVKVTQGATTTSTITVSFTNTNPIWRIGDWDGTPDGFLNADKIHTMHPSDARMAPWVNVTHVIGTNTAAQFPMAQFRNVNDIQIKFSLTDAQAAASHTLRIGVTIEQHSAAPSVVVVANGWVSAAQTSVAVATRGLTRGVTHGNFMLYEFPIPEAVLLSGTNTFRLGITSDETDVEKPFLRASLGFDALELL